MKIEQFSKSSVIVENILPLMENIAVLIGENKNDSFQLYDSDVAIVPGLGMNSESQRIIRRNADMRDGIFKVLVFGQFSNGKSTLINSLLGESTLRAKAVPTTAIITMLVYGDSDSDLVTVVEKRDQDQGDASERKMTWDEFRKEFTLTIEDREIMGKQGFVDRFRNVMHARVARDHTLLQHGVRLIDSPGLGDQTNRTLLATNYLRESQAVIFVLNALRILNQEERDFINHELGSGQLTHVFFVVNFINLIEEVEDREELEEFVKISLRPHFLDENGFFDEDLYNSRVFFINAKGALDARLNLSMGGSLSDDEETQAEHDLYSSGMVRFEKHLITFLTSDQKLNAILNTAIDPLTKAIASAQTNIRIQRTTLKQDIDHLIANKRIADERLNQLQKDKENILQQVDDEIERIELKVYQDLQDYISEMHELWECDAGLVEGCPNEPIITLSELSFIDVMTSLWNKKKIQNIIENNIKRYVELKFNGWSEQIPDVIDSDLQRMLKRIGDRVYDFGVELSEIKNIFAGEQVLDLSTNALSNKQGMSYLQGILGIIAFSPDMIAGSLTGRGSLGLIIGTYVKRFVALLVLSMFFTAGVSAIILAVTELIFAGRHKEDFRREALSKLGQDLFNVGFPKLLSDARKEIKRHINDAFAEFKFKLETELQDQIDETRKEQERIIDLKTNRENEVEAENKRLDHLSELLLDQLNTIYEVGYHRALTNAQREVLSNGEVPSRT